MMRNRKVGKAMQTKHRGTGIAAEPLKVWCVSSLAYSKNANGYDEEDIPISIEATGIPHLRAFMLRIPAEEKLDVLIRHVRGHLSSLISSMESFSVQSTTHRRLELREVVARPRKVRDTAGPVVLPKKLLTLCFSLQKLSLPNFLKNSRQL